MDMRLIKQFLKKGKEQTSQGLLYKDKINVELFCRIRHAYIDADPDPGYSKYLEWDVHVQAAKNRFEQLIAGSQRKLRILDIGTGAGYFPFVCNLNGHCAEGLDVPDHAFYTEMTTLLHVNRHGHRITSFTPIPHLGRRFDLITAFAICFNNHATPELWGVREWSFFLTDLQRTHLTCGGKVFLMFNPEPTGEYMSTELLGYFNSLKATICADRVLIPF